jgi:hypothetical protein
MALSDFLQAGLGYLGAKDIAKGQRETDKENRLADEKFRADVFASRFGETPTTIVAPTAAGGTRISDRPGSADAIARRRDPRRAEQRGEITDAFGRFGTGFDVPDFSTAQRFAGEEANQQRGVLNEQFNKAYGRLNRDIGPGNTGIAGPLLTELQRTAEKFTPTNTRALDILYGSQRGALDVAGQQLDLLAPQAPTKELNQNVTSALGNLGKPYDSTAIPGPLALGAGSVGGLLQNLDARDRQELAYARAGESENKLLAAIRGLSNQGGWSSAAVDDPFPTGPIGS